MFRTLWNDEAGLIISAELVLVLTIAVIGVVVGLNAVAKSVNNELLDVASAIGAVDQTYFVTGFRNEHGNAATVGFGFSDQADECDCAILVTPGPRVKVQDPGEGPGAGGPEAGTGTP
ncbi:hypothetical protein [Stratiformator vulcanicus]|uniref:Branched-chain amino acid aminotransferase n=1 Tax=Stratiformator vulcanicus TaxID=2527980 RepID=A0A517R247_9PLAN|nr:hypothetical protein [Stratiformator vulcanicus]QDT37959.1 hypothetical protein Pan189_23430 [Stratiformator vulcanicus]